MRSGPTLDAATAQGMAALAIWSTNLALSRSVAEFSGGLKGVAAVLAIGGAASLALAGLRGVGPRSFLRMGPRYLLGCGGLFVGYMACLYAAIALAPDRATTLAVGLLNYLWPSLMVAFAGPLLGQKARLELLVPGCLLAVIGCAVALAGDSFSVGSLPATARAEALLPAGLAALAGVLWALYSNLARRFGPPQGDAVPLFLLASAAAVALLAGREPLPAWSGPQWGSLLVLALGPTALAYTLWERGISRGDNQLLGVASYFLPVASLAFAAAWFRVMPGASLAIGCGLVMAGAWLSRRSLARPPGEAPSGSPGPA